MSTADFDYDVVVVGYGYAGGIAAIHAHDLGARVLVVEKAADPGGISVCSAGGLRICRDVDQATSYLLETNAGTTPELLLRRLAAGMATLADDVYPLCAAAGAELGVRESPANYPLTGYETFGFAYVDSIADFDPARSFPTVRGAPAGARLFEVVRRNVASRSRIEVQLGTAAERLICRDGRVCGISIAGRQVLAKSIILASGGFESDPALQAQFWPVQPVLPAAVLSNTGDGLRMAQAVGAGISHMWHFHGSYGFRHPDPTYPFGVRVKRLPDWNPAVGLRGDVKMSWILLDRDGRRFMNEYEPYMQDTGHRPFEHYDPVRQRFARVPAIMLTDAVGRASYPLSAPTWHDKEVADRYADQTQRDFDAKILFQSNSLDEIAARFGFDATALSATIERWNDFCGGGEDGDYMRPPGSMMPILHPPFSAAEVWPIVSNTQGGLAHDENQRVLDAFGQPIEGLLVAGELGSSFGHLYMSGGNIAECFIGGRIAGMTSAQTIDS